MKQMLHKYSHAWVFLYAFIYIPWFFYLEKHVTRYFHVIQTDIDKKIPFIEYFIIPYLLWFAFIAATILYLFFTDKSEFYKASAFMIIGMTVFLIISTVYPNGQLLRPYHYERDNIFISLVKRLYLTDTPTNVFPSIHVYNTIGAYIAIRNSVHLKQNRWIQNSSLILSILIILSTMFLKQHSVIDVIGAFIFSGLVYPFVYTMEWKRAHSLKKIPT